MNCHAARELMLEADPDVLRSRDGSLFGDHLAGCADCTRAADAILTQYATLDYALRKLADANATAAGRTKKVVRRWLPAALIVPIAAAAAVVVLLRNPTEPAPTARVVVEVPRSTVVNAGGPGGVAVMQTRDPKITIVWNF